MACEDETGNLLASLPACAVCATVETGIGAIACAAALWNYYQRAKALNECLHANGLAGIDAHVDGVYAEASYMQELGESVGATATA